MLGIPKVCTKTILNFCYFIYPHSHPPELTTEPRALCLLGNHSTTVLNSQSLILNFKVKLSYKETYLMYYLFSISSM